MKLDKLVKQAVVKYVVRYNMRDSWMTIDIPTFIESAEHYECESPYDFYCAMEWEGFYDLYKDVYGVRPRWTHYKDLTLTQWQVQNQILIKSK